jgi:hypothetical protein
MISKFGRGHNRVGPPWSFSESSSCRAGRGLVNLSLNAREIRFCFCQISPKCELLNTVAAEGGRPSRWSAHRPQAGM